METRKIEIKKIIKKFVFAYGNENVEDEVIEELYNTIQIISQNIIGVDNLITIDNIMKILNSSNQEIYKSLILYNSKLKSLAPYKIEMKNSDK